MYIHNNVSSDTCSHNTYYTIKITPGYCCNVLICLIFKIILLHKKKVFQIVALNIENFKFDLGQSILDLYYLYIHNIYYSFTYLSDILW